MTLNTLIKALGILMLGVSLHAQSNYTAYKADADPTIDGVASEACWQGTPWKNIDQLWIGTAPSASDFQGKFKVCWRGTKLFILAEVVDNVLYDGHSDPLVEWYNDDCLEIFIDEDNSNGNHQCNYSAFAYHVATNGDNVDLGTDCNPHLYNSHITSAHTNSGTTYTWEVAMTIYSSAYTDAGPNTPVTLYEGKICGFTLAYCDDDGSNTRESFMGSEVMPSGHNNDNYITADYFGNLNLGGPNPTLGLEDFDNQSSTTSTDGIRWSVEDHHIHFLSEGKQKPNTIAIFDCLGHSVESIPCNNAESKSSTWLQNGTYLLYFQSDNGVVVNKVVIY